MIGFIVGFAVAYFFVAVIEAIRIIRRYASQFDHLEGGRFWVGVVAIIGGSIWGLLIMGRLLVLAVRIIAGLPRKTSRRPATPTPPSKS